MKLISNEIVFRGHPDKLADQIGDKILMDYIRVDPLAKVNVDVVGGAGIVFITGTIYSNTFVNIDKSVREVLEDVGYMTNVKIVNEVKLKSLSELRFTKQTKKYDDNVIFGFACNETPQMLPKSIVILQEFAKNYANLCKKDNTFLPDGKVQLLGLYDDNKKLQKIKSVNISYQNNSLDNLKSNSMLSNIFSTIAENLDVEVESFSFNDKGDYKIGGFDRDTGLIGMKTLMGSYQGFMPVGAGEFSGKDPTNTNRCATHKARQIAKDVIKQHNVDWCEVQLEYDENFEVLESINIKSNIGEITADNNLYEECKNENIVKDLELLHKNYLDMSAFGHFQN